jgi:hypothetical protein
MGTAEERLRALADFYHLGFTGSPHEGEPEDQLELSLHELAHAKLIGTEFVWPRTLECDIFERPLGELNEVRACAVELLAAELLGIRLHEGRVARACAKNSKLSEEVASRAIRRTIRTKKVRSIAADLARDLEAPDGIGALILAERHES